MISCAVGALVGWLPNDALAQAPPDTAALAKAFQKLRLRVDRLEKEVNKMKAASPSTATVTTASTPPAPAKPVAGQNVPLSGWKVEVVPAESDTKDAVASFSWDKPEFNFGLHTKLISGHNLYTYRGIARFHPDQKARYVFQLTLEPLNTTHGWFGFICAGNLKVNDEIVVEGKASAQNLSGQFDRNGELFAPATFSGGTELEPSPDPKRDYLLTLQVSCYPNERDHAQLSDYQFKPWQDNRFSILVKGPDDAAGRPFAGDELYHAGKVKAVRQAP